MDEFERGLRTPGKPLTVEFITDSIAAFRRAGPQQANPAALAGLFNSKTGGRGGGSGLQEPARQGPQPHTVYPDKAPLEP